VRVSEHWRGSASTHLFFFGHQVQQMIRMIPTFVVGVTCNAFGGFTITICVYGQEHILNSVAYGWRI